MPDTLCCDADNCSAVFTGQYRNGNLNRHRRLKHRGEDTAVYRCIAEHCSRIFLRQDARLKHYRRHHPSLAPRPITLRGSHR
jgi:uncharacterized Zn-finger protein